MILIGTGSEVKLAVSAGEELKSKHGIKSRIVSMPSTTIFDQQSRITKKSCPQSRTKNDNRGRCYGSLVEI